jgi:ribosomal protein S18 acetylase RimI-like enzyme
VEFRVVSPGDAPALAELFSDIDETFFRPHQFTEQQASEIANHVGRDIYAILLDGERPVAYGMLRGWDEGYETPSLGIAVRSDSQGRGLGRLMMTHLHAEAARHGAKRVRLRVHPDNYRARRLYETLWYEYAGEDRGELVMLVALRAGADHVAASGATHRGLIARLLDGDAPEWAAVLRDTRHDFYHLPAYATLCAGFEQGDTKALYIEGAEGRMLLPLVVRRITESEGYDAASPYGYPGPLLNGTDDQGFVSDAFAAGMDLLGAAGVVSLFVRFHPLLNTSYPQGTGVVVRHGETVSIDLTLPEETIWAQMRQNHRRDIKKAVGAGLYARFDPGFERYDAFKRLYRRTMERRSAAAQYLFGDEYFDGLRDALGERLHLCIVECGDAVAAAGLFVETNGIVQYHLGGSDQMLIRAGPMKLMIHYAACWAKGRGNRYLHLGGGVGGVDDSLFDFKLGFSPLRHSFYTLRAVVNEAEFDRLMIASGESRQAQTPDGFFPPYRAR